MRAFTLALAVTAGGSAAAFAPAGPISVRSAGSVASVVVRMHSTAEPTQVLFPEPLTGFERTARAASFYGRVLPVLAAYATAGVRGLDEDGLAELDEWGSTRVAETIKDLKGFYVKSGQVISTRVDLFPEAYVGEGAAAAAAAAAALVLARRPSTTAAATTPCHHTS